MTDDWTCSGTGKTLICKAIASQSNSKFFSISASTMTSKWMGEVCFSLTFCVFYVNFLSFTFIFRLAFELIFGEQMAIRERSSCGAIETSWHYDTQNPTHFDRFP